MNHQENSGKKFYVNVEGNEYEWERETIMVQEIRQLGDIPDDQGVISEDPDGNERTLDEHEVVTIQPGHRHGRSAKYKRG